MSNCTKAGDAWIQRLACITFEKMPSTPFEPGGTAAARSARRSYTSTDRSAARSTSSAQNASRNQRSVRPE